jgi:hypothetical protein
MLDHDKPKDVHGSTIATSAGVLIDPFAVTAADGVFDIEVIAHALSMQCRYAGHTSRFYSVAEHSLLVERVVRAEAEILLRAGRISAAEFINLCRWAHSHDDDEAYLPDMPAPDKRRPEMTFYRDAGARLMGEIAKWLGLEGPEPPLVKHVDVEIRGTERAWLFPPIEGWKTEPARPSIVCGVMTPEGAKAAWLARFFELWPEWPRKGGQR